MLRKWYAQFRAWDAGRKFGCELGDFLILLFVSLGISVVSILVIGGLKGCVLSILTIIICQWLWNRSAP